MIFDNYQLITMNCMIWVTPLPTAQMVQLKAAKDTSQSFQSSRCPAEPHQTQTDAKLLILILVLGQITKRGLASL